MRIVDAYCIQRSRGGKLRVLVMADDDPTGEDSRSDGPTNGAGGRTMEGGKTFVKIIALDGDPETDDASLHGVYRSDEGDTAEKRVALTHDEWTRVREGEMPFALEIESERVETIARSRPKRVGDVASTGVPGTTAC